MNSKQFLAFLLVITICFSSICMEYSSDEDSGEDSDYDRVRSVYYQRYIALQDKLFKRIVQGNVEEVQKMLDTGISVDSLNSDNDTPLMVAARYGHKALVSLLLERHATIDAKNNRFTALLYAAARGYTEIVLMLIQAYGKQVNKRELSLALIEAAQYGYLETALALLEAGALLNVTDTEHWTAIGRAAFKGYKELVKLFMDRIKEIPQDEEETFLNYAALLGDVDLVERLIKKGVDVRDSHNQALAYAARGGSVEVIQKLLDYGANPNGISHDYISAVTHAASRGHINAVKLLITAGADINYVGKVHEGYVLCAAIKGGHLYVVDELIKAGAQVNVKQGDALIEAVKIRDKRIIQRLIQAGAKISLVPPTHTRRAAEVIRSDIREALEVLGNSTSQIMQLLLQSKACNASPEI